MLSYNELKPGTVFVKDGDPYTVLDYQFVKKQRGKPIVQIKMRNLITGKVVDMSARQNETFEEADISSRQALFIYENRGEYWFRDPQDPSQRFSLSHDVIGDVASYLIPDLEVGLLSFNGTNISVELPIKLDLKVTEAPPSVKGNTAEGGTKTVITETDLKVNTPLFIEQGDVIRVNTSTGEYVERVEKG